ncbi:hypothetical protein L1987_59864 [Smallanthus sonchifolius]|uniref:Uncharacterized protein n=1 Tax=Smallanthus sonchifolius TaxID=185202 RepID=A0ACB9D6G6_9ASTR|nr:hypothetical protein L1987_59864 [Smallanthus sonchifolius]
MLAFWRLWAFFKLSIASAVMLCLEAWYYQVLVLIAGLLENLEITLDSLAICTTLLGWVMMISFGFNEAASVRVSNELGAGHPKSASFSIIIATLSSLVISLMCAIILLSARHVVSYVFTDGESVANAVSELTPLLAVSIILNGIQPVLSGNMVGHDWGYDVADGNSTMDYVTNRPGQREQKKKPKRQYQVWKGSNRFLCGGRLIFGPDVASLCFSMLLVAGPAISFCVKVHNIINHKKKHGEDLGYWYEVLIVAAALTCLDITFLFMTSSRDPGIVPRNASPPDPDEAYDLNTPSMEWIHGTTPHLRLPRTKDVIVNNHTVKVKYCDTCMLYRPPRVSHCSVCNNCVMKFDHHCPWVGQCIGLRNYRFFYMFISTSTVLCIYVFSFSWVNLSQQKVHILKAMSQDILSDFLIVYCFIAVWFVGGLTIFHFYLICSNQTTYENFRYRYSKKENPYHKGVKKNLVEVFFSKIPPSLNDFRAYFHEDDGLVMDPTTPNLVDSPKEKIDIEQVNTFAEAGGFPLPQILLHHGDGEENMRSKVGNGASDTLPSPFLFETNIAAPDLVMETRKPEDGANVEEKHDEETITFYTPVVHQI